MSLKSFWQRLKYWQKGFLIGILLVLSLLLFLILIAVLRYDGKCVSLLESYNCSFIEHMRNGFMPWGMMYVPEFWMLLLIIILITALIGYYIDK